MDKILVIGSTNIDFTTSVQEFPKAGETVISNALHKSAGGKGANQAYACGMLGGDTSFISAVGNDGLGELMLKNMSRAGVNTENVFVSDLPTGMAVITVDSRGENTIVVASGANTALDAGRVLHCRESIDAADIVLLQCELPMDGIYAAIKYAKGKDKTVIFNPAPCPAGGISEEIIRCIDIITPNETELQQLSHMPTSTAAELEKAAKQLIKKGAKAVIVTMGGAGALLAEERSIQQFPAYKVPVVDTTAAGDTFNAGLAVKLAEHAQISDAIMFANAAAALSTTKVGAQTSVPGRKEVDAFIAAQK